ncbi:hypothetical protein M427DRAFT_468834 [Gonapodya prolifera JEL478]|uniref:Fatty acid hydroxylase domain-containing protein n=1 Tax=Gonapodya prolifera (strain JEL478) TaxID=1344416 RepID=A0A139AQQ9_GONPJ|nr:hypothetical protein M427DRAFT_468834 [Gonapodya prolifera JEL478]|eukprot:KXS19097.1 hypothetical protein M427DRAFT_468834 [Gonapodya prolifera JEL478]
MAAIWPTIGKLWVPFATSLNDKIGGVGSYTLLTTAVFWANYIPTYCFFRYLDHTGTFKQYKLHPGKMEPQSLNDKVVEGMRKGWWRGPPRTALMYFIFFHGRMNMTSFPKFTDMCLNILMGQVLNDCLFYFWHRASHHPNLYKTVHKQHHEYKVANVGATSWNAAIESFIILCTANLCVSALNFDLFTWLAWVSVVNYLDHHVHCGYSFPWNPWNLLIDPEIHDYHHFQNAGSYGTFPLLDWIFGTDRNFRGYKQRRLEAAMKGLDDGEKENRLDVTSDTVEATGFV